VAGITGAFAVVSALYTRDARGGAGQVIDVSLLEPLLGILGPGPTVFDLLGVIADDTATDPPTTPHATPI